MAKPVLRRIEITFSFSYVCHRALDTSRMCVAKSYAFSTINKCRIVEDWREEEAINSIEFMIFLSLEINLKNNCVKEKCSVKKCTILYTIGLLILL